MKTMKSDNNSESVKYNFLPSFVAGGVAGLVVDVVLFPIDSVKTRLQSERGFIKSGGFKGIYKGLAPAAAGSVPTAALFFCTYESCKTFLNQNRQRTPAPIIHMLSASAGEVVACLIRVPVEIAKQRRQALSLINKSSALQILFHAYQTEGIRKGLYRGFGTTIMREIPFSLIQFPLWEYFKMNWKRVTNTPLTPASVAICGACAGGIAAGLTTPFDVAKTRVMLAENSQKTKLNIISVLVPIYKENGFKGLFAGFVPRVMWITLGGAFFFGFYDLTSQFFIPRLD